MIGYSCEGNQAPYTPYSNGDILISNYRDIAITLGYKQSVYRVTTLHFVSYHLITALLVY